MVETNGLLTSLEAEASEQLTALRAFRTYRGMDSDYRSRAKIALGVIGAYVRLRGTLANEETNELVRIRLVGQGTRETPKALVGGVLDQHV